METFIQKIVGWFNVNYKYVLFWFYEICTLLVSVGSILFDGFFIFFAVSIEIINVWLGCKFYKKLGNEK